MTWTYRQDSEYSGFGLVELFRLFQDGKRVGFIDTKEMAELICQRMNETDKAVAEVREACAALCFKRMPEKGLENAHADPGIAYELGRIDQAQADAAAIRARGKM